MNMVDVLALLGMQPVKISRAQYWYLSPFRNETAASFKINRALNRWYDHGEGCGGNLVDFFIRYFKCSVYDVLRKFETSNFFGVRQQSMATDTIHVADKIEVINGKPIEHPALTQYLKSRGIPLNVAQYYCQQVHFSLQGKKYFAIGFGNKAGGYELRNKFFKGSASPKDVTVFLHDTKIILVFEGFFDFLTWCIIHGKESEQAPSILVLNSTSFFEKQKLFLETFERIILYMDNDHRGRQMTEGALQSSPKYIDRSKTYAGYKDLNEWHQHAPRHFNQ